MYNKFKNFNLTEKGVVSLATLGDRIRQLRECSQLSQEEFGKQFGIVKSTVSLYEHDKSTPDDQTKISICQRYGVTMDWLYGLSNVSHISLKEHFVFHFDFDFQNRINSLIDESNLSEGDILQKLGVSKEQFENLKINGTTDLHLLISLSDIFNVPLDYILCRSDFRGLSNDENDLLISFNKCDSESKKYLIAKAGVLCIEGLGSVAAADNIQYNNVEKKSHPSSGTEGIA